MPMPRNPQPPRILIATIVLLLCISGGHAGQFYENKGITGLAQTLRRISSGVRVLHIAAHPDDEDSSLVAKLSLGDGARVTYLSLTRGEGGQNLIGPEFFEDLGVLRTSELLAARRLDGGEQLFGRQIDYGYSKSPDEAFQHWPEEEVVRDIVRAIRRTRPHIVYCRFSGTRMDGHGQHTASVLATRKAIEAAGDRRRYRELIEKGLQPWRVQKFYTGRFTPGSPGATEVRTDSYDPWVGRSLGAVGYAGRSMHRSQDMGMIEFEESRTSVLLREIPPLEKDESEISFLSDLRVENPRLRTRAAELLLRPRALNDPMILTREIAQLLRDWRTEAPDDTGSLRDLEHVLAGAMGLRLEAFAASATLNPGGQVVVDARLYKPGGAEINSSAWEIQVRNGLTARREELASGEGSHASRFTLSALPDMPPSLPYFLREEPDGDLYRWPREPWVGDGFSPPLARVKFSARYERIPFSIEVPVTYRYADPAWGEVREPLTVTPPVSLKFDPPAVRLATGQSLFDVPVSLVVENHTDESFESMLTLYDPRRPIQTPITVMVELQAQQVRRYPLILSEALLEGEKRKVFSAYWRNKGAIDLPAYEMSRIDYRHIEPTTLCRPAKLELGRLDVSLPSGLTVGYVQGSGDGVGEVLQDLGAEVVFLDRDDLTKGDLSGFDAIVTGSRAYEVRDDLVESNPRLLNYVRSGGVLVVQYNKYAFEDLNVAPLPMSYSRPHDRVTDESSAVEILKPRHPIFTFPNEIRSRDFEGWIQDRGLYFWSTWDRSYVPLMATSDPGEKALQGGMMYLKLGRGHYIYTGYAFFRQLPEGVEGATRLFANLVSLARAPEEQRR